MANRVFILTVLVLYSSTLVLAQNQTTYLYKLPSGQKVLCDRCPPGFHLQTHCTEKHRTVCQPCDEGFYTAYWNYIYSCLPCNWCSSDEVVVQECTRSTNRVCGCKKGFYRDSYICRPHTVCPHGYGVKEEGTLERDTVCERCEDGYYSARDLGHTRCLPHTVCKSEEKLLVRGTNSLDNVCVTCDNIIHDGWVKYISQTFIEIFKNHSTRKTHRFIFKHLSNSDHIYNVSLSGTDHVTWIQQLQQWFSEATEQQVKSLPEKLHKFGMKNLATNIEQRIKRIQDEVTLCKNSI